jgi:hypothetical protein
MTGVACSTLRQGGFRAHDSGPSAIIAELDFRVIVTEWREPSTSY